jgi:hypothetical protein
VDAETDLAAADAAANSNQLKMPLGAFLILSLISSIANNRKY